MLVLSKLWPVLFALLLILPAEGGVLYKWVDKKGQIHITDYPPPEEELQSPPEKVETGKKSPEEERPSVQILKEGVPEVTVGPPQEEQTPETPPLVRPEHTTPPERPAPQPLQIPPDAMTDLQKGMDLLRFGGLTLIIFLFALSLFFYFFWSICLYLIAKKQELPYAWLSWVPILQVFPFVGASGRPLWWAGFFLAPLFFSLLSYLTPVMNILSIISSVVVFFLSIVLWLNISERLGQNRWLGLLILVPLVQFFYIGYLAFKSEERPEVNRKRPLLIAAGVYLILVVAMAITIDSLLTPLLGRMMGAAVNIQQERLEGFQR